MGIHTRIYGRGGGSTTQTTQAGRKGGWRKWCQHHSPFPIFPHRSFWSVIVQPLAFSVRALLFFLNAPTDVIYSWLARSAAAVPYPPPLVDACRCSESHEEKEARISALLESYNEKIEENRRKIVQIERALLEEYRKWFIEPCYPDGEEKVPEGWCRVKLTDLVEINPAYNIGSGKEVVFAPIDILATEGPLGNRDRLKRCITPPSSIMFRDSDTLFPFQRPWLENGRGVYVDFVGDMALGSEFGCASPDMLVLRGTKLSPEVAYCLSKDKRLRQWCKSILEGKDTAFQDRLDGFSAFTLPMPTSSLLDKFQIGVARPNFGKIIKLSQENERLKRSCSRVLENSGRTGANEQAQHDFPPGISPARAGPVAGFGWCCCRAVLTLHYPFWVPSLRFDLRGNFFRPRRGRARPFSRRWPFRTS